MSSATAPEAEAPKPAQSAEQRFLEALKQERAAACQADVDRLLELQEEKRQLLRELRVAELSQQVRASLASQAQRNLALLRQLVQCYSALSTESGEPTYDAHGQCSRQETRALRGYL